MAKMAVFKPIMWNDKGYVQPAGCPSTSGYSHDHGYGHEEWNNNPNWMWQGWRVFHTEATKTLEDAAHDGNLAMIMIAANGGMTYALGAAVGIFANDATQRPLIAAAVKKLNDSSKVWSLPTVQKQFAGNQNAFVTHWNAEYTWIRWRCLPQHFYWFPDPVKLNPVEISGKRKLVSEHSRFQETTPEVLIDILENAHLPKGRNAIREWLAFGEFSDPRQLSTKSQQSGSRHLSSIRNGANAPSGRAFEYWVEGNRKVEPLHDRLQKLFVQYLKSQGIHHIDEDQEYVDVRYTVGGQQLFCELKPTDNVQTRYAIRAAIGQILWYRYKHQKSLPNSSLQIVIGSAPSQDEVDFVKSIGLSLIYYDNTSGQFETA